MISSQPQRPLAFLLTLLLAPAFSGQGAEAAVGQAMVPASTPARAAGTHPSTPTPPAYDEEGRLLLPGDYRQWIFAGSSLGLSYTEGATPSHEMFHETLIEPGAYRHFVETGEFADGTMLVLILHGTGEGVLPGRRGRFAAEIHGVEMAVKDFGRHEEEWAYYGFGGMDGIRRAAEAFPARSCHDCHLEHAARDNVFLQFYPMLAEAAGVRVAADRGAEPSVMPAESPAETAEADELPAEEAREPLLAYGGLDPVMLVAGREEAGKAEIVQDYRGWRYRFASEPNRASFAADPARYAPQNETCLVVPGATNRPDLFTVLGGKVYAFATAGCIEEFLADPRAFLPPDPRLDEAM